MKYEFNLKTLLNFFFRLAVIFLAAVAFSFGTTYAVTASSHVHDKFQYEGIEVVPQKPKFTIQHEGDLVKVPQGVGVTLKSTFKILEDETRVYYDDRAECFHPDGSRDLTRPQNGNILFKSRTFSGFPKNKVPVGFMEHERATDRSSWEYSWIVSDVPPVNSECRIIAVPYVKEFFDLIEFRHTPIYSNWFAVVDSKIFDEIPE